MTEARVRKAFADQARWCAQLGSPFTSLLMQALGEGLEPGTPVADHVLGWQGDPDAMADSVPLRLAGALHALVREGEVPALGALYPPAPLPSLEPLQSAALAVLESHADAVLARLAFAPQTNEVARAAMLYAGLSHVAASLGLPFVLWELGASAGLNLFPERFGYRFGEAAHGQADAPVQLSPAWEGSVPASAAVQVVERRGVDLNPLDVSDPQQRSRLLSYVWPDQPERLQRAEAAVAIALEEPPRLDRGDAADWVDARMAAPAQAGVCRVLWHSIAFQYFPSDSQRRIVAAVERAGAAASAAAPLAWLAFEQAGDGPALTLRQWPGDGAPVTLARADAHVRRVRWGAAEP